MRRIERFRQAALYALQLRSSARRTGACDCAPPVQRRRGSAHAYRGVCPGIPDRRVFCKSTVVPDRSTGPPPDTSPEDGSRHAASDPRTVRLRFGHRHLLDPRHALALTGSIGARSSGDRSGRTRTRRAGGSHRAQYVQDPSRAYRLGRPAGPGAHCGRHRQVPCARPARGGGSARCGRTSGTVVRATCGRAVSAALRPAACGPA